MPARNKYGATSPIAGAGNFRTFTPFATTTNGVTGRLRDVAGFLFESTT